MTERSAIQGQDARPGSPLGDLDLHLFAEGKHCRLHDKLGAHFATVRGKSGVHFAVWAPEAERVSVLGDFNGWDRRATPLEPRGQTGVWEGFVPGLERGERYKYHIASKHDGYAVDKADPFGIRHEMPPRTASIVWDLPYEWGDESWMRTRGERNALRAPIAIYEVHPGSWARVPEEGERFLNWRELAERLGPYVERMGYTHVELMPVMEHPFYGSWGYQVTGYFAPSSRHGTPQDFMAFVDSLHRRGIGVIVDWVPAHFPTDEHGLGYFDGTHLFEHADPRRGFHPDWNSFIFNYGRHEVRSFLLSSAHYWLERYHIDGLRVDGVASMLYRNYSREEGEWIPNEYGGTEDLEAIGFLREMNESVFREFPDVQTIAEESTAWPMVSRPTYVGGLGFGMKWDMGWMHDTLHYVAREPVYRKFHHNELTFRSIYAFNENFVLPLSHDEVVHGKGSLLGKMPGDQWQKFANLRALHAYMYAQPGKKMLFMGGEFGQWREWNHDQSLDWHLTHEPLHAGVQELVARLNRLYRDEPALHELDVDGRGFEWVDASDSEQSVIVFLRKSQRDDRILVAFNFTPEPRPNYRIGVDTPGLWRTLLDTDAGKFGGSGYRKVGVLEAKPEPWHGRPCSLNLTLPPLGALFLKAGSP
jgi:1,4-alpha-glucan branching enzyme